MKLNQQPKKPAVKLSQVIIWTAVVVCTAVAIAFLWFLIPGDDEDIDVLLNETTAIVYETEPEKVNPVPCPDIDEQLLTVNKWSRPGKKVKKITKIVIHYLANPGTTAQENHDYFESLKDLQDVSMSANYIIGLQGEIIECVPPGEVAYASNDMNKKSISIENCHLDTSGRFTQETYDSLIRLTAWLLEEYGLGRDDIIRHYDVTGKACPIYYVENEDKWEKLKDDVMDYIEECRASAG